MCVCVCVCVFSRRIIDDSRSLIDDYRVPLQLVASFTIVINDDHILIVQTTANRLYG